MHPLVYPMLETERDYQNALALAERYEAFASKTAKASEILRCRILETNLIDVYEATSGATVTIKIDVNALYGKYEQAKAKAVEAAWLAKKHLDTADYCRRNYLASLGGEVLRP